MTDPSRRFVHCRIRRAALAAWLMLMLLLAACQGTQPAAPQPPTAASAAARQLPAGAQRFVVDAQASQIRLLVYRAGALARLGHNHVIVGRVRGEIEAGTQVADSSFRLQIPLDSFAVDPPDARDEEGAAFTTGISDAARRATRDNMLGKALLDAAGYPLIEIESVSLVGPRWNPTVVARTTLRGATHDLQFPAAVFEQPDALTVIASFRTRQSDFGLTPYTVLGGSLRVQDEIDVRLRIVARRSP